MAEVYRLGRRVAFAVRQGNRTIYLLPGEAKALGSALSRCAADIKAVEKFSDSQFKAKTLELADPFNEGKS